MAFIDDIGKKLSQAGQTAVQKTKDMTDLARLNAAVSDEEKKINNYYFQIGKLYATMHSGDYEKDFSGMISAVKESESKIRDFRQQIQNIKGLVRCEKCGAEVSGSVAFCSSCGSPMSGQSAPAENSDFIICTSCGAKTNKNMRFCTSCGKPVTNNQTAPASTPNEIKKCPQCGIEVKHDAAFCTECGTKF